MDVLAVRRAHAAAAIAGTTLKKLAADLGMDYSTLRRQLIGGDQAPRQRPHEREALIAKVADLCNLPVDFFSVDFSRLPELAREEVQTWVELSAETDSATRIDKALEMARKELEAKTSHTLGMLAEVLSTIEKQTPS